MRIGFAPLSAFCCFAFVLPARAQKLASPTSAPKQPAALYQTALEFLATLTPEQRGKATFDFEADERLNWHFVPRERKGIGYAGLTDAQKKAGQRLLQAGLSASGYHKAETIRALEYVLQEIENDKTGANRNPDRYYFSIFGEPAQKGTWGLRYEGHHVSLNWTIVAGRVLSSSPQFLGANPARVPKRSGTNGPSEGTRVLGAEEDLGRALVRSLTPEQRKSGVGGASVPGDIFTGAKRRIEAFADEGITYKELSKEQRVLLVSLIEEYARVQPAVVAAKRLESVRASLDTIRFLWLGSLDAGQGHYYRVQGRTFVIEYDNTQNAAYHVHSVWRDFKGDFSFDPLAEHYRQFAPGTLAGRLHGHTHGFGPQQAQASHNHAHSE